VVRCRLELRPTAGRGTVPVMLIVIGVLLEALSLGARICRLEDLRRSSGADGIF
jgi:hypothetical protein